MRSALVTGANRGIGLELVRQVLDAGDAVVATARRPDEAHELAEIARGAGERACVVPLDVADPTSVAACGAAVADRFRALDLLVNNAGVWSTAGSGPDPASVGPLAQLRADAVLNVLRVNVAGALLTTQACAPLLTTADAAVVANLSSGLGSLARNPSSNYGYAISKAALNMATRQLATELAGVTVVSLDPGWVRTELGGAGARVDPEESVTGLLAVIADLDVERSGGFFNRRGEPVDW